PPAARTLISGAAGDGVSIKHGATGHQVEGNYIGTSVDGMHAIPNGAAGVAILHARHNTIGGDTPAARNLISANTGDGVLISEASYNVVERNFIGTDRTGSGPL